MTIKKFFSGLKTKSTGNGWNMFFSSAGSSNRKSQAYYFGIIFSAIDAIAKGVQNVEYGLYKKQGDEWTEVFDNDAIKFLQKPNNIHSDRDFLYLMSSHIDLFGQAFLWPIRTKLNSSNVVELRLINPGQINTIPSIETLIEGYKWNTGVSTKDFSPEELINLLRPDPNDMINGLSTIQKAKYEGDNELNSQQLNASFYENGGLPSGVISTDAPVDQPTFNKLKSRIQQQYSGVKNAYKMMFLTHGANYKAIQPTQRDMEYVSQRKLNRTQILSIFQVPESVIGISESSNRSTAEVEYRAFMKNVVETRLKLIFSKLNRFYLPLFNGTEGMELRFTSPVPNDKVFELSEKVASVRSWRTPNEIRVDEGLEPIEGGDTLNESLSFDFDTSSDEEEIGDEDKDDKNKAQIEAIKSLISTKDVEKKTDDNDKSDHKHKIEDLPKPSEQKGKALKAYTKKRNAYIQAKEKKYALELAQHFNFFIRDLSKASISKAYEDLTAEEKLELTPEKVSEKILPKQEKIQQWKAILFVLVLKNNTQIWKTAGNQLKSTFGLDQVEVEGTVSSFISDRANFTSKSISDTLFTKIKTSIGESVKNGDIDLKVIKRNVLTVLKDAKDWKVEQIARTELAWSYSESQMKTYRANEVEKVEWVCGSGACPVCEPNCGQVVELNKTFPSGDSSEPAHINCRCMVAPA